MKQIKIKKKSEIRVMFVTNTLNLFIENAFEEISLKNQVWRYKDIWKNNKACA